MSSLIGGELSVCHRWVIIGCALCCLVGALLQMACSDVVGSFMKSGCWDDGFATSNENLYARTGVWGGKSEETVIGRN